MSASSAAHATTTARARELGPPLLPRLLKGFPAVGAMDLETHLAVHGEAPAVRPRRRREEAGLIGQLERAGLRGRGGGAFSAAAKLRAVAQAGRRPVVVVNAAEGEPASSKDATLSEVLPQLVLDGALLAAEALRAEEVIVCVSGAAHSSMRRVAAAIAQLERAGRGRASIRLAAVPDHYVAGQESALINHLNGGPAVPTFMPPTPFEAGVSRRPTLVNNSETLAHVALIARHGSSWYRQLGTRSQPGSALVTLTGPVAHPGVYEIECGASLQSLIDAAGGSHSALRGALLGGYAGGWVRGEQLHGIALSDEQLAPHSAALGCGAVVLLSEHTCPVAETVRVARWLAAQSTRQCGPCLNGLPALADALAELQEGAGRTLGGIPSGAQAGGRGARQISALAAIVSGRGACRHPDGAVNFILSALRAFAPELEEHARAGRCERCARASELPLPPDALALRGRVERLR